MTFNLNVVHNGSKQALGEHRCGRRLRAIRHDQRKFITAETRKECLSGSGLQTTGDFTQQCVADQMSIGVIGLFEVVKVNTQNSELFVRPNAIERSVDIVVEGCPVGQVGQRVIMRQVQDALFRTLPLCHVFVCGPPPAISHRPVNNGNVTPITKPIYGLIWLVYRYFFDPILDVGFMILWRVSGGNSMLQNYAKRRTWFCLLDIQFV